MGTFKCDLDLSLYVLIFSYTRCVTDVSHTSLLAIGTGRIYGYSNVNFTAVWPKGRTSRGYRPCRRFTRPWRMDLAMDMLENSTL